MGSLFAPLVGFARDLAGRWSTYLSGIVALSLLCMAILQTLKDLSTVRRTFHEWFLRRWFEGRCANRADIPAVETDLIALATDGDRHAFFDLPIEQLCGRMTAAAHIVVEEPHQHKRLLQGLTAHAPDFAIKILVESDRPLRLRLEALKRRGPEGEEELQALAEAKTRMMHQIQRSLDGLQISASYRWKLLWQLASFGLAFALALIASDASNWPHRLFVGMAAGFLAPVARDLQARVQLVK